ncbi:MAG: B12-binding domain-containing radical SAM protein [Promethearchaeota archaeon]
MKKKFVYVDDIEYPDLKGMRVMLITPNTFYRKKAFALGMAYIATAMQRCNIDVQVMSCNAWSYDDIEIARIIIESGITIFGIGGIYPMIREVVRICSLIRRCVPNATIILGGPIVSPTPEFILKITGADIGVIEEADFTIPYLMRELAGDRNLEDVPGLAFFENGEFIETGPPTVPKEITKEEIGWPAWDLFPIEHYITAPHYYPIKQTDRVLSIVTGRGCPYSCNFCYRVCAFRPRPTDDILDEMEYLIKRYNLNAFHFLDDLVMRNEKKITELCDGIINRKIKIRFQVTGRINIVNRRIIQKLKDAGCISIFYGVESGDENILKYMRKEIKIEKIYEAVAMTREFGLFCKYGFMFGQPHENEETLRKTVEMIKKLSYGEFRKQKIFGCIPFPGTELYDWCLKTGRLIDAEDFYNRYVCQDWSLVQFPVNMTDLPDEKAIELFYKSNEELSNFFDKIIFREWGKVFRGNTLNH